jgi:hypothetical protein
MEIPAVGQLQVVGQNKNNEDSLRINLFLNGSGEKEKASPVYKDKIFFWDYNIGTLS